MPIELCDEQLMAIAQANQGAGHVPGRFPGAEDGDGYETEEGDMPPLV